MYIPLSPEIQLQRASWVLTRLSAPRCAGECKTRWNELAERVLDFGPWFLLIEIAGS